MRERLLEDRRVRGDANDGVVLNESREPPLVEQVAREIVDPDRLPKRAQAAERGRRFTLIALTGVAPIEESPRVIGCTGADQLARCVDLAEQIPEQDSPWAALGIEVVDRPLRVNRSPSTSVSSRESRWPTASYPRSNRSE